MAFKDDVKSNLGIQLTDVQLNQFNTYFNELITYNTHTNLTSITEEHEVYYKHFYDSLLLSKTIDFNQINQVCDMGSGAGFPSIPLKIVFPHLEITIIDSLNKRITFLNQLVENLELKQIHLHHDRIENYAINHQMAFDLVTARALGNLRLITEMGLPMTRIYGHFIAMKSAAYQEELTEATYAITKLGGKIDHIDEQALPYDYGNRANIDIVKIKHIKGYPRKFNIMTNKPLS